MRYVVLVLCVLLASGCWTVPDKAWWPSNDAVVQPPAERSEMLVLEFKESGEPFHPEQQDLLHAWLEVRSPDDPLIVFVHGWHHNAWYESRQRMDRNLDSFRGFLRMLEDQSGGQPLDAIYVGWRGDSMDTIIPWESSDFLSFWCRKRVSETVGRNGVSGLLDYLRTRHPDRKTVIVGHSFGGSVVLHAVRAWLDQGHEMPDNTEYVLINPAVHYAELESVREALEARALRLQAMGTGPGLLARPHRKLLVLQAKGDLSVRWLYPLALGETAVGFDKNRITHRGHICPRSGCVAGVCDVQMAAGFVMKLADHVSCEHVLEEPLWVVLADDGLSKSHNDIFNGTQAQILSGWITQRLELNIAK